MRTWLLAAAALAAVAACTGQQVAPTIPSGRQAAVVGDPGKACQAVPRWALVDSLGVVGRGSPQEAARDTARSHPELPDGPWEVVAAHEDEAFLAPSDGPWRLEAVRTDDLGWYVVTGLTFAGTAGDPAARPPLADD